jgi:ATP-dependent Clp protease, protease subunit
LIASIDYPSHYISLLQPANSDFAQMIDIEAAMYRDRTIMISKFIDEQYANQLIAIILYLRSKSLRDPISLYFNCPGAQLRPALALYDLIQQTKEDCTIDTINLGLCVGMASILCAAGTKGKRSAMPNARFMLSRTGMDQPFRGQATDIALEVKNIKLWNTRMENDLVLLTGQSSEIIAQKLARDWYFSADEAVQFGMIDYVMLPSPRKRAITQQATDLGSFEGSEEQRYQNQEKNNSNKKSSGGWGSQRRVDKNVDNDDNGEPKTSK